MNKEEYYKWIEDNDTYPKHSHQWILRTYTAGPFNDIGGSKHIFYRNFGPFETSQEAKRFIEDYKTKYTTNGFISMYSIEAICSIEIKV